MGEGIETVVGGGGFRNARINQSSPFFSLSPDWTAADDGAPSPPALHLDGLVGGSGGGGSGDSPPAVVGVGEASPP